MQSFIQFYLNHEKRFFPLRLRPPPPLHLNRLINQSFGIFPTDIRKTLSVQKVPMQAPSPPKKSNGNIVSRDLSTRFNDQKLETLL